VNQSMSTQQSESSPSKPAATSQQPQQKQATNTATKNNNNNNNPNAPKILIIGALSFLGSHLLYQLVEKGYHVRGTVKHHSSDVTKWANELKQLTKFATGSFTIYVADILSNEHWKDLFVGIEYVFHLAFPHHCRSTKIQEELLVPAVEGTKRLLEFAQQTKTMKKFILTSCYGALADVFENHRIYKETDWNEIVASPRNSYAYSKACAEKMAVLYCFETHFQLVSIVPGVILGPPVISRLSFSHDYIKLFLDGTANRLPDLYYPIVDVRDVALAEIIAMEKPDIIGRYCLSHPSKSIEQIMTTIRTQFPDLNVPTQKVSNFIAIFGSSLDTSGKGDFVIHNLGQIPRIDSSKAMGVGMELIHEVEDTIEDTVQHLQENYLLDKRPQVRNKPPVFFCTIT